ncbi:MAG: hypothetical protein MJE77_25125 [Proteobacteria bacterium]|nr:hypothetical protein [Pseudomonadota bacterium]
MDGKRLRRHCGGMTMATARLCTSLAALLLIPGLVWADADEESLSVHVSTGGARIADPIVPDLTAYAVSSELEVRYSKGTDWLWDTSWRHVLSYELSVAWGQTLYAMGHNVEGVLSRNVSWARAEAGLRARFGYPWMASVYTGLGSELLYFWRGDFDWYDDMDIGTVTPTRRSKPFLVALGGGLDYRVDKRWLVGVQVVMRHSAPWTGPHGTLMTEFRGAYHWY